MDKDYVQYSKKVTKWAMILIAFVMIACLLIVAFCNIPSHSVNAIVSLFTAFSTVLGVTVGAYQGNSTLEKYSNAKYRYEGMLKDYNEEDEDAQG
ncbi:MAG: hypothetical protein IKS31_00205 [Clostridia bacterium]|nr:hypothetical protein [Clostridia bacterium]